jgi:hypothetical protein
LGQQAYLMARTLTLPRPPPQLGMYTMMWRFCVFNLPRVNKTEPLYFYSLLLRLGITLLPLYSRVSCPFRLSQRWQMNLIWLFKNVL